MCEGKQTDTPDPDVARMVAFRNGDEEAFVTLYRQYRDRIYNFTRRLLGDAALAEEATQDAFLKLYAARDRYEARSRFSTYLFRIARNHCLNLRARHDNRRVDRSRTVDHAVGDAAGPDREAERTELRAALSAALAELPESQATALVLAQYEGLSYREIASVLGVSESATKSLIHRARERMMKELRGWTSREGEVSHAV